MNQGKNTRPQILVLEGVWSYDFRDKTSVRPFIEGWANTVGLRVGFRTYHNANDLLFWLTYFSKCKTNPNICYIAGHGGGKRLFGAIGRDINFIKLIKKVFPRKPGPKSKMGNKGILIGACQLGGKDKRQELIDETDYPLAWVAGYEETVPWLESTLSDLLFLKYLVCGFTDRSIENKMLYYNPHNKLSKTKLSSTAAKFVNEDYQLMSAFGFGATDRK